MTGAIPVTKIVPARPITKAPHQPVSRFNPPEAYCSSSEAEVCLESGAMDLAPPLAVSRRARRRRQILPGNKVSRQSNEYAVGCSRTWFFWAALPARMRGLVEEHAVADEVVRYRESIVQPPRLFVRAPRMPIEP